MPLCSGNWAWRTDLGRFSRQITATDADIDELGHVNNVVWVRWIQDIAVAHWESVAPPDHQANHVWVITRHEVDYRGNVRLGETVTGETWVPTPPKGARFDRHVRFFDAGGTVKVEAITTWALLDRTSGRLMRVTPEIAAPFFN